MKTKAPAARPKRGTLCGACGCALSSKAVQAYVATFDVLDVRFVCATCAARGILIVSAEPAQRAREILRPFARHLRLLAKPYELNGDGRAVGLHQAADVLESGRAVVIASDDDHMASLAAAAMTANIPARIVQASRPALVLDIERSTPTNGKAAAPAAGLELGASELGGCEVALLTVLVSQPRPIPRAMLGLRSGYSVTSGGYSQALGRLRELKLIEGPSSALRAGAGAPAALGAYAPPDLPVEVVSYWAEKVGGAAGTILQVATAAYPKTLSRLELAERAGYRATSGGYSEALGQLRRLHLLDGCRASDALMSSATLPPHA